jgi:hypothetical protein
MAGFVGGSSVVAYPFNIGGNEGFFLLEIDDTGLMSGAAYQQTTTSAFASSQGYGLDLTGINGSGTTGTSVEVDDIAEFVSSSTACGSASGSVVSGIIDENFAPGGGPTYKMALCGNYQTPDSNGRGAISAAAGNNSNSTLNGGFNLIFYSVDGTTFPFMEEDSGQVAVGVFVLQNAQASSSEAAAKFHMFMPPTIRSRAALKKLVATPRPK